MRWIILLAGGSGSRVAQEVRRHFDSAAPKQYAPIGGPAPLVAVTLTRARRLAPDAHIVVTTARRHRAEADAVLGAHPTFVRLEEPEPRDTTAGILLPLLHVQARDPDATVVVMPTDHTVADEALFGAAIDEALAVTRTHPEDIALLVTEPGGPIDGYGWVVPADAAEHWPRARRFREKPGAEELPALVAAGALVSTFVLVARADALLATFAARAPECLAALSAAHGDDAAIAAAFARLPTSSYTRDVLEHLPERLRLVRLPSAAGWLDIGTPERLSHWRHRAR